MKKYKNQLEKTSDKVEDRGALYETDFLYMEDKSDLVPKEDSEVLDIHQEKQLNKNRIGYKKTKLGWIPEEWEVVKFRDIADKNIKWSITGGPFGSNLKAEDYRAEGVRIIQLQNIGDGRFLNKNKIYTSKEKADELIACNIFPNEIILSKMGDPVARACIIPNEEKRYLMASDGIRLVCDKEKADNIFVLELINSPFFRNNARKVSTGSTRQRIGLNDLKNLEFLLPPLQEQIKIAEILSTWDKTISEHQALINAKMELHKGLMQQLLTGRVRFEAFQKSKEYQNHIRVGQVPKDWKVMNANEIFKSISKKNNVNEVLLSVTQDRGVIPRDWLSGNVTMPSGSTQSYKLVEKGNFIISLRSFQGGLEYSEHRGIVSPAYTILTPKIKIDDHFFRYFFKSTEFIGRLAVAVIGIRDGKQISFTDFSAMRFRVPSFEEQQAIAAILQQSEAELEELRLQLSVYEEQKRGLMQQLLSGAGDGRR